MYGILCFPFLLCKILSSCSQFGMCNTCTENECTSCYKTYGIDKRENSNTKGHCIPCQSYECRDCSDDAQICTECKDYNMADTDRTSVTYGKCTKPCLDFNCKECNGNKCLSCYYPYGVDENGICQKCNDPNCDICRNNYKICIECALNCGKGVDLDTSSKTYGQCIPPSAENCEKPSYLDASKCVKCKKGYLLNNDKKCIKCQIEHCSDCTSNTNCFDCEDTYYLINDECQKCPDNCKTCDSNYCYSCVNGYYLDNNHNCIDSGIAHCQEAKDENECINCIYNYGYNSETKQCIKCKDTNCLNCTDDYQKCYKCTDGFFLENQTSCVTKCANEHCQDCSPDNNNYCNKCDDGYGGHLCNKCSMENCAKCYTSSTLCDVCAVNYSLKDGHYCVPSHIANCEVGYVSDGRDHCSECISGYYSDNGKACIKCERDCEDCYGQTGICKECKNGKMPDFTRGSSSYGMCSNEKNDDLNKNTDDGDIPEWAVILIIVACGVVAIAIIAVIIYCICKKKKGVSDNESP